MAKTLLQRVKENSLNLSASQLRELVGGDWPDALILDYLAQLENVEIIAGDNTDLSDRVEKNELDIVDLKQVDEGLQNQINSNDTDILDLQQENANQHVAIDGNTTNISNNTTAISDHINSDSAHGVTGNNVGSGDFATSLVGGVVLLASLVSDAADSSAVVSIADVADAPATYDQAHIQSIVDLANDTKSKHNQLVLDLNNSISVINAIIQSMITAKQMADS